MLLWFRGGQHVGRCPVGLAIPREPIIAEFQSPAATKINSCGEERLPYGLRWMKRLTFHRWVTHATFLGILFVVLLWFPFPRANDGRGVQISVPRLISVLVDGVVVGGALIAGFYFLEG